MGGVLKGSAEPPLATLQYTSLYALRAAEVSSDNYYRGYRNLNQGLSTNYCASLSPSLLTRIYVAVNIAMIFVRARSGGDSRTRPRRSGAES